MALTLAELEATRREPGRSCLVFLTDRCPVGCAHCSVDSRPDSPRITDHDLFHEVVAGVLSVPGIDLVGVSGGEPFIERRALTHLVRECAAAGRRTVLYTSGVWAGAGTPAWVHEVLAAATAVVLSLDAYHAAAVPTDALDRVVDAVLGAGCSLVVQTVDLPDSRDPARRMAERWAAGTPGARVEVNVVPPLSTGRGRAAFAGLPPRTGRALGEWGACGLLAAPVVRYDGLVVACCNESVLMGAGPDRLRRRCRTAAEVAEAVTGLRREPLLQCLSTAGTATIARLPWVADPGGSYGSICEACWALHAQFDAAGDAARRSVRAVNAMLGTRTPGGR